MKLLMILLCKGTYALVAPPLKGQGGNAPVLHPKGRGEMPPYCTPVPASLDAPH